MKRCLTFISLRHTSMRSRAACISTMMSERNGVDNWLSVPFRRNPDSQSALCKTKTIAKRVLNDVQTHGMSAPIPQLVSVWSNGQPCWIISNGAGMPTCLYGEVCLKTWWRLRGSMTAGFVMSCSHLRDKFLLWSDRLLIWSAWLPARNSCRNFSIFFFYEISAIISIMLALCASVKAEVYDFF